jgi:hypothetical protein
VEEAQLPTAFYSLFFFLLTKTRRDNGADSSSNFASQFLFEATKDLYKHQATAMTIATSEKNPATSWSRALEADKECVFIHFFHDDSSSNERQ